LLEPLATQIVGEHFDAESNAIRANKPGDVESGVIPRDFHPARLSIATKAARLFHFGFRADYRDDSKVAA
jgi:hypothetical protein